MTLEREKEILAAFYAAAAKYEKVAQELRRLLDPDIDPSVPFEAIYTIKHRLKDEGRLVEKLAKAPDECGPESYRDFIDDLLGMRIVCLRLSDVDKIEEFVNSLIAEEKLRLVREPEKKKTFVLRVDPREEIPEDIDLQYSGYSSIHYILTLGDAQHLPEELTDLKIELQVRTLLEEAWGEIDHKYRYALARGGKALPKHVELGFYSFAAYLQAAALQAEFLCMEAEAAAHPAADEQREPELDVALQRSTGLRGQFAALLTEIVGFVPSDRTLRYVEKRLGESNVSDLEMLKSELLTPEALSAFKSSYRELTGLEPFESPDERDVDLINALNSVLFRRSRGAEAAETGLKEVLRKRFSKGLTYELVYRNSNGDRRTVIRTETAFPPGTILPDGEKRWQVEEIEEYSGDHDLDGRIILREVPSGD